jgi:methyl-accepting chemotaxis protein
VTLVDDAGAALKQIVESVGDISSHVTTIAASANEQSTALEEINSAMSQLDQVTQQNAAMFEQTTAASHALAREAQSLTETTAHFKTSVAPQSSAPMATSAARPVAPSMAQGSGFLSRRGASPAVPGSGVARARRGDALAVAAPADEAADSWEEF